MAVQSLGVRLKQQWGQIASPRSRAGHSDCSGRRRRRWQGLALALLPGRCTEKAEARPPAALHAVAHASSLFSWRRPAFPAGTCSSKARLSAWLHRHSPWTEAGRLRTVGAQVRQRQKDWLRCCFHRSVRPRMRAAALSPRARAPHFACMTVLHCRFLVTKKGVDLFRCGVFCSSAGHACPHGHAPHRRPPAARRRAAQEI